MQKYGICFENYLIPTVPEGQDYLPESFNEKPVKGWLKPGQRIFVMGSAGLFGLYSDLEAAW